MAFEDKDDGCALGVGGFHHLVITFQVALHPDMGLARGRRHLCARDRRSRIRLVNILCYTPDAGAGCIDLNPLPQEVEGRRDWETGEMEGNFSVDQSNFQAEMFRRSCWLPTPWRSGHPHGGRPGREGGKEGAVGCRLPGTVTMDDANFAELKKCQRKLQAERFLA